jgi:hypothetical protein
MKLILNDKFINNTNKKYFMGWKELSGWVKGVICVNLILIVLLMIIMMDHQITQENFMIILMASIKKMAFPWLLWIPIGAFLGALFSKENPSIVDKWRIKFVKASIISSVFMFIFENINIHTPRESLWEILLILLLFVSVALSPGYLLAGFIFMDADPTLEINVLRLLIVALLSIPWAIVIGGIVGKFVDIRDKILSRRKAKEVL